MKIVATIAAALTGSLAVLFAAMLTAQAASAAAIHIESSSASWGADAGVVGLQGTGSNQISWGRTTRTGGHQQSAYRFDSIAAGTSARAGELITLGSFTHSNFAIRSGRNLTSAMLDYEVDFAVEVGGTTRRESLSFDWLFKHQETRNRGTRFCADGGANGAGNNRNGCADQVTFDEDANGLFTFEYAEGTVTLELLGFLPGTDFWTRENQDNTSQLMARFNFAPAAALAPVPLPASAWLLGAALAGIGGLGWRRKRDLAA